MKDILIVIASILLLIGCKQNDSSVEFFVANVSNPIISLNGTWKVNTNPPEEFYKLKTLNDDWKDIQVPGECAMQGISIKHDIPFVYKTNIDIPEDFSGKQIGIQFEGVYSYARVWVNGEYVRDHTGGFTKWTCDITSLVKPGETAILTVEVTDKADEISYGSGYAKHQIGGILRSVSLVALPTNYPEDITIVTDLDNNYKHASLIVSGKTKSSNTDAEINLELFDINNNKIKIKNSSTILNDQTFQILNHIDSPKKWDAEHPNLYSLKVSFSEKNQLVWQKTYKVGFRELTIDGNRLLVNGNEVKLRGACRHDIHPLLGRVSTPEYELKDVVLTKEANMNFIRTSHYPPTENFLQLCDEYGIYVEDETAVCFVGSHRTEEYFPGSSESNPDYTDHYMGQLKEMVSNHKNHPSIILWSVGNENSFGTNFKLSYDWVKEYDPTRPAIFSYPGHVPDSVKSYDILSMHYPGIDGNMNQIGKQTKNFGYEEMPVIFDEWAHVACYNNFTIMEDPNIRSFWGQSLDSMWQRTFDSDGGLGGAIWGMIDETFMLPESLPGFNKWWGKIDKNVIPAAYSGNTIGYGEWGIIDTWRRKKTRVLEYKKAYSPTKLLIKEAGSLVNGEKLSIPLYNRFDHTNTNELTINIIHSGITEKLTAPEIAPHAKGKLIIPAKEWEQNKPVFIEFLDVNKLIDKYALSINTSESKNNYADAKEKIVVKNDENTLTLTCENKTQIIIDKNTGLINKINQISGSYLFSGPHLNLRTKGSSVIYSYHNINDYAKEWKLKNLDYKNEGSQVSLFLEGEYHSSIDVKYEVVIKSNGEISVQYKVLNIPSENIRELGIKFDIANVFDSLSWKRNAYWSYYPENHIARAEGKCSLYCSNPKTYRTKPNKEWIKDTKSFYYEGTKNESPEELTNIAKATKENISQYTLHKGVNEKISIFDNKKVSCRLSKEEGILHLHINNITDYVDLSWGNYQRDILVEKEYSNKVVIKLNTANVEK